MRLTRRGEAVALTAALVLGGTAGVTAQVWNPYTRALDTCRTVDLPEDTTGTAPDTVTPLLAAGWYGDPTDHAERLYSPGCR